MNKICPKCNITHNKEGTYCSRQCANSRTFSVASRELKRQKQLAYWNNLTEDEKQQFMERRGKNWNHITKEKWAALSDNEKEEYYQIKRFESARKTEQKIKNTAFDDLGVGYKRKVVLTDQNHKCNRCSINEWLGKPIILELEHIDGNNKNWQRTNLEFLCPNCHSQTPTWRGRNKKGNCKPISSKLGVSLRQVLLERGLTPKGGNYRTLKKELGII
jgi:hypothetical protein